MGSLAATGATALFSMREINWAVWAAAAVWAMAGLPRRAAQLRMGRGRMGCFRVTLVGRARLQAQRRARLGMAGMLWSAWTRAAAAAAGGFQRMGPRAARAEMAGRWAS